MRADPAEVDEILALDRVCLPGAPAFLSDDCELFVVHDTDGRVCAYASLKPSSRWADAVYLNRAGVARLARGRGLQRKLIRARERWARSHGYEYAITETAAFNSASSNSLIRCGYTTYWPSRPWSTDPGAVYWRRCLVKPLARLTYVR